MPGGEAKLERELMGDEIFVIVVLVLLGVMGCFVGGILGLVALIQLGSLRREVARVRSAVQELQARGMRPVEPAVRSVEPPVAPVTPPATVPVEVPRPMELPPVVPPPVVRQEPVGVGSEQGATGVGLGQAQAGGAWGAGGLETRIGRQWIAWVGAVVVFLSAVFFLKLAFENDWIGPTGQVVICALVAVGMVGTGSHFLVRRWRILGQIVMGLGLAILYATFYSAFAVYSTPVMGQGTAFGFMIAVTIMGMALAVMHDAVSMAFLAVLGGILTPVLVSTGQDSRDTLFTYLLLLDLGVLAVAFFRGWRLLDTLAMVGTFIMYAGWYGKFYRPEVLGPTLAWLTVFYVVFLVLPFAYHLVRKQPVTVERFVMALANAAFAAIYAWVTLREQHLSAMGFVALGMATAYVGLGSMLRRRLPGDAQALFGMIAMAVIFLTLAVPMQLRLHGILLAWVAEAPVLAYLGYRFRYLPVRVFGAAVLVLAVGRLFLSDVHWPLHAGLFVPFWNTQFMSALAVPVAAGAYAWVHRLYAKEATELDRGLQVAAGLAAGLLGLVIVHAEVGGWLGHDVSGYAAASAETALWALGAGVYLWVGTRVGAATPWVWGVGTLALVVAGVLSMASYGEDAWGWSVLFGNVRFGAGALVAVGVCAYAWAMLWRPGTAAGSGSPGEIARTLGVIYLVGAIVGLLALLSTEVYTFCTVVIEDTVRAQRAGQMSITLVWGVYAAALLAVGFWRHARALRLAGLALFGLVTLKLALLDLTFLKDAYRIVSFLVLGLLMLVASYVYHRLEKRLTAGPENTGSQEAAVGEIR